MSISLHRVRRGRVIFVLLAFCTALVLLAITSAHAFADSIKIVDNAHVLNVVQVTDQASQLPNPVNIYTTKTFAGTTAAFDQFTTTFIGPNDSNLIVINIDTLHRHLAIVGGTQVPLSSDQYAAAIQAFKDNFNNGDYTGATIAALQSLNSALTPPPPDTSNNGFPPNSQVDPGQVQTYSGFNPDFGPAVTIIVIICVIVFLLFILKALGSAAGTGPSQRQSPRPLDATPFEAGAIGTMVGYELGREEMERQQREQIQQQMFNNNPPVMNNPPINNFPGGDIGGGASGNFGGGNIGGGSGGNF